MPFWIRALPAFVAAVCALSAFADDDDPTIVVPNGNLILDLSFSSVEVKSGGTAVPTGLVTGKFTRTNWTLGRTTGPVNVDKEGEFQVSIPLTGVETKSTLFAVGIRGQTESQEFVIQYPLYFEDKKKKPKKIKLIPSLGFSSILYEQKTGQDFKLSELGLTGKFAADYVINRRWSIDASAYMTLLPIANGNAMRFLGVNLRGTYYILTPERPWSVGIGAGMYYTTTLVTGGNFGFFNLTGPQLFPSVRRNLANGNYMGAYLKYSMISYGSHLLSPSESEFAGGLSYGFRQKEDRFISVALDIARLGLIIPEGSVTSTSFSLSAAYSF
jgi:hypothetical protein